MVTIDWVKRIVGIIGSLGNLVWTSLLQSQRRIHHSVENVGARCEGRAIQRQCSWFVWSIWFISFISFSEPDKPKKPDRPDRPDKPDEPAPRHAPRDVELSERAFILVLRLAVTDGLR
jgi:hypothetical protein